jgi:hypothetical protein
MGDFVGKEEVEKIRAHYKEYMAKSNWQKDDNRGAPVSGVYDATTFREVSTHYINRLLRYIEVEEMFREMEKDG